MCPPPNPSRNRLPRRPSRTHQPRHRTRDRSLHRLSHCSRAPRAARPANGAQPRARVRDRRLRNPGAKPHRPGFLNLGAARGGDFLNQFFVASGRRRSRKNIQKLRSGSGPKGRNKKSPGGGLEKVISEILPWAVSNQSCLKRLYTYIRNAGAFSSIHLDEFTQNTYCTLKSMML